VDVDTVVLVMCSDEADVHHLAAQQHDSHDAELVAAHVEHHSVLRPDIGAVEHRLDVGKGLPFGLDDGVVPEPHRVLGFRPSLPELSKRALCDDPHGSNIAVLTWCNKSAAYTM